MGKNLSVLMVLVYCQSYILAQKGPIVITKYGRIQGKYTDKAQVFTSVRYAEKPERWEDSVPPQKWVGVKQAVEDSPGCPQEIPCHDDVPAVCPKHISEDCLFLNVFTPLNAKNTSKFPVMVFIPGGAFIAGYSGGSLYDGQYIAYNTNTIVVIFNYRVGALGFLVFDNSIDPIIGGNFGFRDQRLALQWVQDNIAAFGGDPGQVTIWSVGAGAISVALHMTTVKSSGLFNKAIIESDPLQLHLANRSVAIEYGSYFGSYLRCSSVSCLVKKNIEQILSAQQYVKNILALQNPILNQNLAIAPSLDEDITDQPLDMFADGKAATVPLIIGTVTNDAIYDGIETLDIIFKSRLNAYVYGLFVSSVFGTFSKETIMSILEEYSTSACHGDCRILLADLLTDYLFTCSTRHAARGVVKGTSEQTWMYLFNHPWPKSGGELCGKYVCHTAELAFVFHTGTDYTREELKLADSMVEYWTNFAHHGDPNGVQATEDHLHWPKYNQNTYEHMAFETPTNKIITKYRYKKCNFWDKINYEENWLPN